MYIICIYIHIKYVYNMQLYINLFILRHNFGSKVVSNFQLHIDFCSVLLS